MTLLQRVYRTYRSQGVRGLVSRGIKRSQAFVARHTVQDSPVPWARFGPASLALARALPPLSPPVLVLSLPRSGSSWVGETLGQAANALYLFEPLTLTRLDCEPHSNAEFPLDPQAPPRYYARAAAWAFAGLPAFKPRVVPAPQQWALGQRRQRRIVIKEVNPFAAEWLGRRYRPRIIFLLRHPAAVAHSYLRLGWINRPHNWERVGQGFGAALHSAWQYLQGYADVQVMQYEDLCLEPVRLFRQLFDFAGLDWRSDNAAFIENQTSKGDTSQPFTTARRSRDMVDAWRGSLTAEQLAGLKAGFAPFKLPWYPAEEW